VAHLLKHGMDALLSPYSRGRLMTFVYRILHNCTSTIKATVQLLKIWHNRLTTTVQVEFNYNNLKEKNGECTENLQACIISNVHHERQFCYFWSDCGVKSEHIKGRLESKIFIAYYARFFIHHNSDIRGGFHAAC